jgi:hypothetical protein
MELIFKHERLDDFHKVGQMLLEHRLLLDSYDLNSDHPYKLENYFLSDFDFHCLLDRNIVSYLIELVNGKRLDLNFNQNKCFRLTAALQSFFNAARITSEPGVAYNEYLEKAGLEKADAELAKFRSADNLDPNVYLDIALGLRDYVPQEFAQEFAHGELKLHGFPQKVRQFEFNLIIIKKAMSIKADGLGDYEVMLRIIDWMHDEYLFSAPAFHFLSIYFSSKRISGMIKSNSYGSVRNATWDLCLLQSWLHLRQEDNNTFWLLSTMDEAIKCTADLMLVRQKESKYEYLDRLQREYATMWGKKKGYGKKLLRKFVEFADRKPLNRKFANNNTNDNLMRIRKMVDDEFKLKIIT